MGSCTPSEMRLSLKTSGSYIPKSIANLLKELSKIDSSSEKLTILNNFLKKHEEELSKVQLFKNELPQCMLLILDAIETLKEAVLNIKKGTGFEPGSDERGVMEFFAMKRRGYEIMQREIFDPEEIKIQAVEEPEKSVGYGSLSVIRANDQTLNFRAKQMLLMPRGKPRGKNNRIIWTTELHSRFVDALEFLGGPEAATPKQIKEVMKLEGLTIDQKYRLHIRKVSALWMSEWKPTTIVKERPGRLTFNTVGSRN
ncbi:hypothetical protein JCGZ_25629 [Jatropha curcas]|uniref:HHO5-like N-terminal domain-containing protein n=1 Tax=Jatropha curcas TaxID=180498 RepID=A0A067JNG1_JATCU|nr:hypothetical protein JCGZ_25629 [Jatropha curcas]